MGLTAAFIARDLDLTTLVSLWGDRLFLVPVGAVLGALCMTTRLRSLLVAATLGLVVLCSPLPTDRSAGSCSTAWFAGMRLRPADAVLVLSSGMQTDGEPTSTQLSRSSAGWNW